MKVLITFYKGGSKPRQGTQNFAPPYIGSDSHVCLTLPSLRVSKARKSLYPSQKSAQANVAQKSLLKSTLKSTDKVHKTLLPPYIGSDSHVCLTYPAFSFFDIKDFLGPCNPSYLLNYPIVRLVRAYSLSYLYWIRFPCLSDPAFSLLDI